MTHTERIVNPKGWSDKQLVMAKASETGIPPSFIGDKGKKYTLKPDWDLQRRLQAQEKESARRSGRKEQPIAPTFYYADPSGKRFEGTFLGDGSYGGFGGGKPQSSQRSWDNYVERVGPRNPDYIARSGFRSGGSGGGPQPTQRPAPQRTPTPRIPPMPAGSYRSDQYGYGYTRQPLGFTGSPISFTAAGPRAGMGPSPTALSTPPPFPELPDYSSLTRFGGYPMFPYANY
jgi:hypothetical protein